MAFLAALSEKRLCGVVGFRGEQAQAAESDCGDQQAQRKGVTCHAGMSLVNTGAYTIAGSRKLRLLHFAKIFAEGYHSARPKLYARPRTSRIANLFNPNFSIVITGLACDRILQTSPSRGF